ncbi:MAG: fibronectin type III domain-containing protein [Acidobacteriia bacterium]|nr:fibronectin type III domain-containing protein [Terriglobia bacterium]
MRWKRVLILLMWLAPAPLLAADVTLAWDPNSETDLAGYKVYYGTSPRTYGAPISLGKQTTFTVTGLSLGTYYFAVTAYNTAGLESGFSNEVSTTITAPSRCDLNLDGAVNIMDLQALINAILGVKPLSPMVSGDMNGDGGTNVLDVQILVSVILGITGCK